MKDVTTVEEEYKRLRIEDEKSYLKDGMDGEWGYERSKVIRKLREQIGEEASRRIDEEVMTEAWGPKITCNNAIFRALWGFFAFIPFCWLWGVDNFTWFALAGTVYFMPVHWIFDKLFQKKKEMGL